MELTILNYYTRGESVICVGENNLVPIGALGQVLQPGYSPLVQWNSITEYAVLNYGLSEGEGKIWRLDPDLILPVSMDDLITIKVKDGAPYVVKSSFNRLQQLAMFRQLIEQIVNKEKQSKKL